MTKVLFSAPNSNWEEYKDVLPGALAATGVDATILRDDDAPDPAEIDYIVYAPSSRLKDFTPFTNLQAVLNLWAGVEGITANPTLTVPLARMVDFGLTEGMVEWCVGHVLRHHLGMDQDICRTDAGLHLLETNCINAAGFYAADVMRLTAAINDLSGVFAV